ncbi:MAG: efflux RND transporter periplasmic adaptor subunit [Gemmatimonadetes bacterium]|nr:efflux RND transporter periplasmic adaptor subunit [Gemmatimonadota bacterium]
MKRLLGCAAGAALLAGCQKETPPPLYEAVPVVRRDIVVSAEAAGTIEPILVVDVKSKASGEIMELRAETGDIVRQGDLLVRVDPRDPQNALAQAEADLEVANAALANAEAQKRRADQMFAAQVLSEQEHESANLAYANARAQKVRAERAVQNARDQLDDTNVRAPITGTIIQKSVERGQVIASATREVSGGTVLLRMADLSEVQVRTLVDETDIGKVQPGLRATITVDAYPSRPFEGRVLKIEPQSVTQQNVTMFPVLIRIGNEQGLLRPGMNAEVEIHIGQRQNVLAIPNAALRTTRDVGSAAQVLGLDPREVERTLATADSEARGTQSVGGRAGGRAEGQFGGPPGGLTAQALAQTPAVSRSARPAPRQGGANPDTTGQQRQGGSGGGGMGAPSGGFQLPEGVTREQLTEIRRKRESGEALTPQESVASARMQALRRQRSGQTPAPAEQSITPRVRAGFAGGGQGQGERQRFGAGNSFQFGGSYIVFVKRGGTPTPLRVRTGLTDLDYSEVTSGLTEQDTVLLLPSASLVQAQQEMRQRFQRMTGGGGLPGMRNQSAEGSAPGGTTAPPRGGRP